MKPYVAFLIQNRFTPEASNSESMRTMVITRVQDTQGFSAIWKWMHKHLQTGM